MLYIIDYIFTYIIDGDKEKKKSELVYVSQIEHILTHVLKNTGLYCRYVSYKISIDKQHNPIILKAGANSLMYVQEGQGSIMKYYSLKVYNVCLL